MPRYYSDDDDESRTPGVVDNPSDRQFEEYLTDFSICNKLVYIGFSGKKS